MKKFLALMALLLCFMVLFVACDDEVATDAPTEAPTEAPTQAPCTHEYDNECDADCNLCGAEREPAAHVEETLAAVEATCTETGLTEGKKCTVCGVVTKAQEVVPAKGHTEEAIPAVAATCTTTGLTEGKKCTVCGEVTVAQTTVLALGHDVKVVAGTAPTCTETGLTSGKQCTVCEAWVQPQAVLEKTAHTPSDVEYVAPSCTQPGGRNAKVCKVCKVVIEAEEIIPALGHTEVEIPAVEATCTKAGATAGVGCEVCGAVIVAPEATKKAPHNEKVVKGYAASCTAAGLTDGSVCADCGAVLVAQKSIPAAHGEEVDMEDVAPTCTTIGYVGGKKCADCGAITVAQTVVPITHTYDADCDNECNICGYKRFALPAHVYEFGNCVYCEGVDENYAEVEEIITFNEAYNVPFGQDDNGNDLYYLGGTSAADSQTVDGYTVYNWNTWFMTGYVGSGGNGYRYEGPIKVAASATELDLGLFGWVKWYDMPLATIGVFVDKIDSVDQIMWNENTAAWAANHFDMTNGAGPLAGGDNNGNGIPDAHEDIVGSFGMSNARRYHMALRLGTYTLWQEMRNEPGIHTLYLVAKMADGQLIVINGFEIEVVEHECTFPEDGTEGVGVVTAPTCTTEGFTTVNCLTDAILCPSTTRINYVDALGHKAADEWTYSAGHHYHECLNGCAEKLDYTECYGEDYQVCDTCGGAYNCEHQWTLAADGTICCEGACGQSWTPSSYLSAQAIAQGAYTPQLYTYNAEGDYVTITNGQSQFVTAGMAQYMVFRYQWIDSSTYPVFCYYDARTNAAHLLQADMRYEKDGAWHVMVVDMGCHNDAGDGFGAIWMMDIANSGTGSINVSSIATFDSIGAANDYAALLDATLCDHEIVENAATEPTCTENGRTPSKSCSKCGVAIQAGSMIPATGHSYTNDCDTTCDVCDAVREVPAHSTFDKNFDGICDECGVVYLEINYGTADAPISVSDALKYAYILTDGKSSLEKYTAIGTVTKIGTDKGNYLQNVYITDGENEILIYSISMGEGVEKFAVGDVIVVNGYIKNYKGTIEFATKYINDKPVYVYAVERHTFDNACDTSCNDCGWMREVPQHVDEDANGVCDICSAVQGATQEWPLDLTIGGWGTSTPEFVAGTSLADPGIQQYYYKWIADGEGKFVVAFAPENIVVFVNGVVAEGGAAQVVEGDVVELVVYALWTEGEDGVKVLSTDPVWFDTELAPAGSANNPFIIEELGWIGTPEFVAGTSLADPGVQEYHYQWIATGEGKVVIPALENIVLNVNGDWFGDGKADVVEGDVVDITIYGIMDEEWNLITDPVYFSIELAIAGSEKNPFELTLGQTATPEFVAGTSLADPGVQEYHYAYTATADGLFLYTDAENIDVTVNGECYEGGSVAVVAGDVVEITVYGLMDENYALITDPVYFLTEFAAEGSEKNPFELAIGEFTTPEYVIGTSLADPGVSVYFYEMTATEEITLKVDALEYISVMVNGVYADGYTVTLAAGDVLTVAVQNPSWTETTPVSFVVTDKVDCQHENTETIPAVAPTCGKVGSTEGTKCSDCGATLVAPTEVPATGEHTAADAVAENVVDATCTVGGSYESVVKCSVCGTEMSRETVNTNPAGHKETAMEDVAPTCTEAGQTGGTYCSVCHEVLEDPEAVEALGHTEETIPGTKATCTEAGLTDGVKCTVCGDLLTAQEEIPALGHTEEEIPAIGATCTTNGWTAGVKCSVCGDILTAQTEIPAGHKYAADCDTDCDVCGEKRETVVEHVFENKYCVENCTECGASNNGEHNLEYGYCSICDSTNPDYDGIDNVLSLNEAYKWKGDNGEYLLGGTLSADTVSYDGYNVPGFGNWICLPGTYDYSHAYDGSAIKVVSNANSFDLNFYGWVAFDAFAPVEFGVFADEITDVNQITWSADAANHLDMYNMNPNWAVDSDGDGIRDVHEDIVKHTNLNNARRYCMSMHTSIGIWNNIKTEIGEHTIYIVAKLENGMYIVVQEVKIEVVAHECTYPADGTEGVGVVTPATCTTAGYTTVKCDCADILCPNTTVINNVDALGHEAAAEWTFMDGKHFKACVRNCGVKFEEGTCEGADGSHCDTCGGLYACNHNYVIDAADGSVKCIGGCGAVLHEAPDTFHTGEEIVNLWLSGQFGSGSATLQDDGSALISGQGSAGDNSALTASIAQSAPNFQQYVMIVYKTSANTSLRWCTYGSPAAFDIGMNATDSWSVGFLTNGNEAIYGRVDIRWNITASAETEIAYIATFSNWDAFMAYLNKSNGFNTYQLPTVIE